MTSKKVYYLASIFIFLSLILVSNVEAWWNNSCSNRVNITVQNVNTVLDMGRHEINFTIDTTGANWIIQNGQIYFVENNEAIPWISWSPFNSATTTLVSYTNVSAGTTETDLAIYYNCGGVTQQYSESDVFEVSDDFEDGSIASFWTQSSNGADNNCGYTETGGLLSFSETSAGYDRCFLKSLGKTFNASYGYLLEFNLTLTSQTQRNGYNVITNDTD